MKSGHILVVDDNRNVLSALRILLENYFEKVTLLTTPNQLLVSLREGKPDIVLLDMNFSAGINSGNEGLYWLAEVKKYDKDIPVVLFTAYADIDLAVKALKEGASDFVVKPWDNAKLIATLQSAYSLRKSQKEIKRLKEKQGVLSRVLNREEELCWGKSPVMQQLLTLIEKVAKTDANILITGENGTGKEVVAREIHRYSSRKEEPLVSVDMGAITESLFESELFGHVKGAFTDARADRAGKFEAADGGTLFLDEIGNLSYTLQAKLLVALQSRHIIRVGSNDPIPVNIRLICATNSNLHESVQNGTFREDLLYRINTIQVEIPPLRDRKEDISLLADFFLQKYASKYAKGALRLSKETVRKLESYSWPGNVRELQHAVEKAVILCDGSELQPSDFYMKEQSDRTGNGTASIDNMSLDEAEQLLIGASLKRNGGNMSAVAAELGITRPTLYSKIKKYGL
ncbi:sigma-54-dependent transcriptional regulator [Dysgonomonas macrotermitis]|uniref:DNA-binding transcriptional response regulator, NtrC family, contains REC, AAA-type ATPase, and a Fis-type DNA-binding domains n=1 Tax=Dysgonomonas macrotermitis TaxID=1346286 RepID=A0A1M5G7L7_9BACT|nr:sigma-54 dependent transcriptional regulator [Dysgonomonas macrotermitis]SHF99451.1 DNA-binding transcriptional response regulator, NtrC family, contains REC, AAA-type ATPase, and a Fis-type DNA-binding domains [Dysgonomonas macrotermitis]